MTVWLCLSLGSGQEPDLTDANPEQLVHIRVTSASRKLQPLSEAAAAMHVITHEDTRRSGATSVVDILRWVPGHGVLWHRLDTIPGDIERVQVIRGPGAAMWGAKAPGGSSHADNTTPAELTGAHEADWRAHRNNRAGTDLASLFNADSNLVNDGPAPPFLRRDLERPLLMFATRRTGLGFGESYGAEFSTRLQVNPVWRLIAGCRGFLPSTWNLPGQWQLDATAGRIGKLLEVPAHSRVDARVGWSTTLHCTLTGSGEDLIGPAFDGAEGNTSRGRTSTGQPVSGQITWTL